MRPWEEAARSWALLLNVRNTASIAVGLLVVFPCICLLLRYVGDAATIAVGSLIVAVVIVTSLVCLVDVGDAAAGAGVCVLVGLRTLHGDCRCRLLCQSSDLEGHGSNRDGLREPHFR